MTLRNLTTALAALLPALAWLPASTQAQSQTLNTEHGPVQVTVVTESLEHPWSLAFLPDDAGMLVTERRGQLRHVAPDGRVGPPIAGVPEVYSRSQGGLLDVILAPDFSSSRRVYLSYAKASEANQAGTAVGYGRLRDDLSALDDFTVIFDQAPAASTGQHFGSRLVFDASGEHLFITLGDQNQRIGSQQLDSLQGKIVRLLPDGAIPTDNPFVGRNDARPEIWSYGHRNVQGATLHPSTGQLWTHEHGPRGGDEINLPAAGLNYGWPLATHGRNYNFLAIPEAKGKQLPGMEDPWYVWEQSPAVSGMAFHSGEGMPNWQGNLFVGALGSRALLRLQLDADGKVVHEERLLQALERRIRDVRAGPDGALYLLTDTDPGQLLRVGPAP